MASKRVTIDLGQYTGIPLVEHWWVPKNQAFIIQDNGIATIMAHPSMVMQIRNKGRAPLWTRHMRGFIEVERDKRRTLKNKHQPARKLPTPRTNM